jgi:opacity protein-like surface antigen
MRFLIAGALVFVCIAPASAQVSARSGTVGIRGYFAIDLDRMAAQESFDAVLGKSNLTGFGGGVDVLNVWKGLFIRGAVSHANESGNRVFVFNGQPISLGIPVDVSMTPMEFGGGWRFATRSRMTPYVGGGVLLVRYSEQSSFADAADNVSKTNAGYTVLGGVEVNLWRWLMAGAEAQYRGVPNALGAAPVSQDFGENNLGGFTMRILFGVSR